MKLMVLRHMESTKQILKAFSSDTDEFPLTERGVSECEKLSEAIDIYLKKLNLTCSAIHTSTSVRTHETAEIISNRINCPSVIEHAGLRSINSGKKLRGKTEEEARIINLKFMEQLKLYRCGLFDSYKYDHIDKKIYRKNFERCVIKCLNSILQNTTDDFVILVVHHSTLASIMIHFARLYCKYPKNFFGKVDCDAGHFYLLNLDKKNCHIELCNAGYQDLISLVSAN